MTCPHYVLGFLQIGIVAVLWATAAGADGRASDPASRVDPFIGTGGHGHTYPGATLPFGMVQLSPDTRLTGWDGCSGYHYSDDVVYGFSHTAARRHKGRFREIRWYRVRLSVR